MIEKTDTTELKKTKNYFDEELVKGWILEYQETATVKKDKKGKPIIVNCNKELERKITIEIEKIVKAVIQVYRYYIFEPYEDCLQHGMMNCATNFIKFTPDKGSAFNYFSIIAKISILNYTDRKKRHRNLNNIEDHIELEAREIKLNNNLFLEDLETTLYKIIDENYLGKKRKKFTEITAIIVDYFKKTRVFVGKSDLYRWAGSYGKRSIDIREYIKEMKEHVEIFSLIKD